MTRRDSKKNGRNVYDTGIYCFCTIMELLASDKEHNIQLAVPFDVPPLSGLKRRPSSRRLHAEREAGGARSI
jgi:hypothetical protein